MYRLIARDLAAGTALTNTTTETALASHTLAAYHFQAGHVYSLRASVRATATNATDTLRVRVRLGEASPTGTVLADSGAVDVADNDVVVVDLRLTCRSTGTAGVVAVAGSISAPGAEGTATMRVAFEIDSLDTTAAQLLEVTGEWSVANAGNSCQSESYELELAA
jgi:uncharacterized lipoprotein YmbA